MGIPDFQKLDKWEDTLLSGGRADSSNLLYKVLIKMGINLHFALVKSILLMIIRFTGFWNFY